MLGYQGRLGVLKSSAWRVCVRYLVEAAGYTPRQDLETGLLEVREEERRLVALHLECVKTCWEITVDTNVTNRPNPSSPPHPTEPIKSNGRTSRYWTGAPPNASSSSTALIAAVPCSSWLDSAPSQKCRLQCNPPLPEGPLAIVASRIYASLMGFGMYWPGEGRLVSW